MTRVPTKRQRKRARPSSFQTFGSDENVDPNAISPELARLKNAVAGRWQGKKGEEPEMTGHIDPNDPTPTTASSSGEGLVESSGEAPDADGNTDVDEATMALEDAIGIAWFERRFGVPLGDMPGAADVERCIARSRKITGAGKVVIDLTDGTSTELDGRLTDAWADLNTAILRITKGSVTDAGRNAEHLDNMRIRMMEIVDPDYRLRELLSVLLEH